MRTCATTRSRLPPDPWLTSTAARFVDGTYEAASSRSSTISIVTSSWAMPREDSWIAHRGACVVSKPCTSGITPSAAITSAPASHPST